MPNLIFSTCGTSLLTSGVSNKMRKLINDFANFKEDDIEPEIRHKLSKHLHDSRKKLFNSSVSEVTNLSAELNSIVRFYDFKLDNRHDHHILLTTDTFLGQKTGEIISEWLMKFKFSVQTQAQKDLQTADLSQFQWALADLVKWIDPLMREFKNKGYHIIFNLTGGFKSVQGFLQTLSMFYADETLYVFQTGDELFRLPKIPVKLIPQEVVKQHFTTFRKLDLGIKTTIPQEIPEVMLLKISGEYCLSEYGQIIYQQIRSEMYKQKLWPSPHDKIIYGPSFEKSVDNLDSNRIQIVNERIDDLVKYFLNPHKQKRLDFKPLKGNPKPPSTHEIDAWADQDAKRIYGHFENDVFVLDCLDKALH